MVRRMANATAATLESLTPGVGAQQIVRSRVEPRLVETVAGAKRPIMHVNGCLLSGKLKHPRNN